MVYRFSVFSCNVKLTSGVVLWIVLLEKTKGVDVGEEGMLNWTRGEC